MSVSRRRNAVRRVAVVTGSRADYGLLRSTMEAIRAHRRLVLQLVATGMHLLEDFGNTVSEIIRDGWGVDAKVRMQAGTDEPLDQALGLSRGVAGIARFLDLGKTDIVLVLGDRIEAMAGALAGVATGRLVAHIHGGDLAQGDFDDSFRHAITKLAHLHLPATPDAARRIIRMGESRGRVHSVGAPGLDRIREILKEAGGGARRSGRALIVHHATGRTAAREARTMSMILRAAAQTGLHRTVIYPNTDRGHSGILDAIERHHRRSRGDSLRVVRSLDRDTYLRLLIDSDVLLGNSSSGIIEAGTAGTPAVNVGDRQRGRQPSGPSLVHAEESFADICAALNKALRKRPGRGGASVYGTGRAGPRIVALLSDVSLDDSFRRKVNTY